MTKKILKLNRYEESLQWYDRVLQSQLRFGNEATMSTRNNMAYILGEAGHIEEALYHYHQVLEFYTNSFGHSHVTTLAIRHNIAIVLFNRFRYEEAKTEFQAVISFIVKHLDNEHTDTINSLYYLSHTLWRLGKKEEALPLMKEVLKLRTKVLGVNHPRTQSPRRMIFILESEVDLVMFCYLNFGMYLIILVFVVTIRIKRSYLVKLWNLMEKLLR